MPDGATDVKAAPLAAEAPLVQLIVFHVGEEEFAVPIGGVREIVRAGPVTPIPDSPDFIKGLINVRGDIVATIDLKNRFSLSAEAVVPKHVLITQQAENLFGLLVDEVTEVLRIPQAEIKPPHKLMTKIHEEYVSGVVTHQERLIILLELAQVLSVEELAHLSEVTREHRGLVKTESVVVKPEEIEAQRLSLAEATPRASAQKHEGAQTVAIKKAPQKGPRKRRKS